MKRVVLIAGIVVVVVLIFVGMRFLLRSSSQAPENTQIPTKVKEFSLEEKPYITLTPTVDGHRIILNLTRLPKEAKSVDYELVYTVENGKTQAVVGSFKNLENMQKLEKELLLGSCSSGKCRYDKGVEKGELVVALRNEDGSLLAKFSSQFHLQNNTDMLTSLDGQFSFKLASGSKKYFIVASTIGVPKETPSQVITGPYGVFAAGKFEGRPQFEKEGTIYQFVDSGWQKVKASTSGGTFVLLQ